MWIYLLSLLQSCNCCVRRSCSASWSSSWREAPPPLRGARWKREDDGGLPSITDGHGWGTLSPGYRLAAVLTVVFVRGLTPLIGWDDNVAHLTLPKISSRARRVQAVAVQRLFELAAERRAPVCARHGTSGLRARQTANVAFLGLLTAAVIGLRRALRRRGAGLVASRAPARQRRRARRSAERQRGHRRRVFFFVAATLAVEFRERGDRRALVVSGIFCGLVAGSKITGLAAVLCILPLIVAERWPLRRPAGSRSSPVMRFSSPRQRWRSHCRGSLGSFVYTGDPMYPGLGSGSAGWNGATRSTRTSYAGSAFDRDGSLIHGLPLAAGSRDPAGRRRLPPLGASISKSWIFFVPLAAIPAPVVPACPPVPPTGGAVFPSSGRSPLSRHGCSSPCSCRWPPRRQSACHGGSVVSAKQTGRREFANGRISRYWLAMGASQAVSAFQSRDSSCHADGIPL